MKKSVFFGILLIGIGLLFIDKKLVSFANIIKNDFMTSFFLGFSFISSIVILFLGVIILFFIKENKVKKVIQLIISILITIPVSFFLKFIIQRPRPYQEGLIKIEEFLIENNHLIWNFSFASFHSILAFSVVPILSKEFPQIKWAWFLIAGLISFSRFYFGLHYLSDIIIGGLIGYLIGEIILKKGINIF